MDTEYDIKSTTQKTPACDNKGTDQPEIKLIPETDLIKLRIKYENALQESEKLRNEITILKRNKYVRNNDKKLGEADLSITESPPVLTIKPDNDVTTKLPLNKIKTEPSHATEPLRQGKDDNPLIYTIQTRSFLEINRAREQFDFIADLLQPKDYNNLRIEKIRSYYAVRLGKYDNYSTAEDLLQKLIHKIKSAVVLKAYIKESRIMKQQRTQSQ